MRQKRCKVSRCKIIILTTFARAGYFERARKAGVRGYLLKDSPIEELVSSIRTIMDGRRIYAPELVDIAYGDDDETENPLTERESQVLELIAEGKTTKEIAGELYLTPGQFEIIFLQFWISLASATGLKRFRGLRRRAGLNKFGDADRNVGFFVGIKSGFANE